MQRLARAWLSWDWFRTFSQFLSLAFPSADPWLRRFWVIESRELTPWTPALAALASGKPNGPGNLGYCQTFLKASSTGRNRSWANRRPACSRAFETNPKSAAWSACTRCRASPLSYFPHRCTPTTERRRSASWTIFLQALVPPFACLIQCTFACTLEAIAAPCPDWHHQCLALPSCTRRGFASVALWTAQHRARSP